MADHDLSPDERAYYSDGTWYDAEYVHITEDIPYYQGVAEAARFRTGGEMPSLLELACGTGRLTLPMARAGASVLGLDLQKEMLERARAKRLEEAPEVQARLRFKQGDMRTFQLNERSDAIVWGLNTLLHMIDDDDLLACLRQVREHLNDTGRFYFDLFTPEPALTRRPDPNGRYDPAEMIDPRTQRRFIVTENHDYDARTQIHTLHFFYQEVDRLENLVGEEWKRSLRLRVLFPRELDRFLRDAGLRVCEDWDDFDKRVPFTATGGRRVVVAERLSQAEPRSDRE